jgi:hypothetical protein
LVKKSKILPFLEAPVVSVDFWEAMLLAFNQKQYVILDFVFGKIIS